MKVGAWLATAGTLCVIAQTAGAELERTISAWDTRFTGEGQAQVSVWGSYWTQEKKNTDITSMNASLYVSYGILDNWSVGVSSGFVSWDLDGGGSESGIGDTELYSVHRFMDESASGLDMAVLGSVGLPTGDDDKGLGSGNVEPGVALIAAKTFGPVIAVANAGTRVFLDNHRSEENLIFWGSLEGILPVSSQLSLNAAVNASTSRWKGGDDEAELGAGVRLTPQDRFFVVLAGYLSLTDDYDWGAQAATGYEF